MGETERELEREVGGREGESERGGVERERERGGGDRERERERERERLSTHILKHTNNRKYLQQQ